MFYFSPSSWTELWDEKIFEKGTVQVEARLVPHMFGDIKFWRMEWCVTRL